MKNLTIILLLFSTITGYSQIRAFDNSKAILPWIYNPSANFINDFEVYLGYDGRGTSSFMPQSVVAGMRVPVLKKRIRAAKRSGGRGGGSREVAAGIVGVQLLNTSQDIMSTTTLKVSYAHRVAINSRLDFALGLGFGLFNLDYDYNSLDYLDQGDPLLNSGESFYNMHMNAGFSLVFADRLFLNVATPEIMKNNKGNIKEVIVRAGYIIPMGQEIKLTAAANLDTYNHNLIFGVDTKLEWKERVSLLTGADRYKYHVGLLLKMKPFGIGYTYGQNYEQSLGYQQSHQISVFSKLAMR
jgi:hypothetical protein